MTLPKLDNRLSTIAKLITQPYQHIWDCCCDHGHLGMALLSQYPESTVHFVDCVPSIIESLSIKLEAYKNGSPEQACHWKTHLSDLKQLNLDTINKEGTEDNNRHLMIIAGIGGDLTVEIIHALVHNNPNTAIDFILCPIRQEHEVRINLSQQGYGLEQEQLVREGSLTYEIIYATKAAAQPISMVGSTMWDLSQPDHQTYLKRKINHFEKASISNPTACYEILEAYKGLKGTGTVS